MTKTCKAPHLSIQQSITIYHHRSVGLRPLLLLLLVCLTKHHRQRLNLHLFHFSQQQRPLRKRAIYRKHPSKGNWPRPARKVRYRVSWIISFTRSDRTNQRNIDDEHLYSPLCLPLVWHLFTRFVVRFSSSSLHPDILARFRKVSPR